jgi:Electron transfer DM13
MTKFLPRPPWFFGVPLVLGAGGLLVAFSYIFTADLFYETCANERNLLTGEFEPSNCGEGAKVARALEQGRGGETATPATAPAKSPQATPAASPQASTAGVVARGTFRDGEPGHDGAGTAELQRLPDGSLNALLADFSVTNGPDLFVVLSTSNDGDYSKGDLVLEPRLKANNGTQNYAIPPGTDLTRFKSIIIWCRQFDVTFAYAPLEVQ